MENTSLLGREREYNEVHRFIEERLSLTHCKSLFVFGACGCGKTSTIHRAMRRVTHRPMAFDKAAAAAAKKNDTINNMNMNSNNKSKGGNGSRSSVKEDNSPATPAAKRQAVKRQRDDEEENNNNNINNNNNNESGAAGSPLSLSLEGAFLENTIEPISTTSTLLQGLGKQRRVQCHYVNCADMTSQQLCDGIINSFRTAQPRMDAHTRELLQRIETLPKEAAASKRRQSNNNNNNNNMNNTIHMMDDNTSILSALGKKKVSTTTTTPLHILALDEVEYVRSAARGILTVLSALSVELSSQLALIFISNQRELVHVPHMLLKELPFEAYSVETLERIGARIVASADFTQKERQDVQLSSGLIAYIAKKAILEYSGDVRQVAAMCRRLVYTAQQDINSPTHTNTTNNNNNIINNNTEETPRRYSTTSSINSNSGSRMAGALSSPNNNDTSPPAAAAGARPNRNMNKTNTTNNNTTTNNNNNTTTKTTTVVTLAQSQKVLRGPSAVSDHVITYVSCMPEQMLYVLSCLVVLAQRQEKERHLAQSTVTGVVSSSSRRSTNSINNSNMNSNNYINSGCIEPGTFTMRVVHRLYTALMARRRFPAMTPAGIAAAIDGFADVGVLSRPQRRGGDDVFAFTAAWPTETLTRALTSRSDGAQNRVVEALQELAVIVGV